MVRVILKNSYTSYLLLTDDQYKLLKWLDEEDHLAYDVEWTVEKNEPEWKKI